MFTKIVLFVAVGIFLILFTMLFVRFLKATSSTEKTEKKLGDKPGGYQGPAGEPIWDGALPVMVKDYTSPRYVYDNGYESTEYLPEHGRIIGYRISPSLVIHSHSKYSVNPPMLMDCLNRLGGRLLRASDINVLMQNWDAISDLRVKAGDTPLKKDNFWFRCDDEPVAYNIKNSSYWPNAMAFSDFEALLILKR